jgi:hypothetical protein
MSEKLEGAIEEVEGQIRELESKVLEHKKAVNILCGLMGREPKYSIEVREDVNTTVAVSGDAYYGKETSEVIADILRRRKRANKGPATVADIFEAMKEGGFHFEASNDANRNLHLARKEPALPQIAHRCLRIGGVVSSGEGEEHKRVPTQRGCRRS